MRNISREITSGPADCSTFSSNLVPFPVCVSSILLSMNILPHVLTGLLFHYLMSTKVTDFLKSEQMFFT